MSFKLTKVIKDRIASKWQTEVQHSRSQITALVEAGFPKLNFFLFLFFSGGGGGGVEGGSTGCEQ